MLELFVNYSYLRHELASNIVILSIGWCSVWMVLIFHKDFLKKTGLQKYKPTY